MKRLSIMVVIIGMVSLAFGCGGAEGVEPDDKGTLNITMEDSNFTPENIELKSGRKVRMVLNNNSTHDSGFAIGLDVVKQGGSATGFQNKFFDGVEVKVIGPAKLVVAGGAIVTREGGGAAGAGDGVDTDAAQGFLVLIEPSSEPTVIEFIVPESYGEWEFASFGGDGTSYDDGMRGSLKVFPCLASSNSRESRC